MKKMLVFVAIVSLMAGSLFANEEVLIDFGQLAADVRIPVGPEDEETAPNQNRATMMDFSGIRFGASFTEEQRRVMRTSLAIENWEVELASSSRAIGNMIRSYTREAPSRQFGTVMGVRIHFPLENFHSWALIRPPFEIPGFDRAQVQEDGTITQPGEGEGEDEANDTTGPSRFEGGYGIVKNVGTIRSIAVNVHGLNFPHRLSVVLFDGATGERRSVSMGNLNFDGWGELRWDNPAYIQEVRNRDLRIFPLYPNSTPFLRFGGFEIRRDASQQGGDFISYFKDVKVIFDKAVLDVERDIDDEGLWRIIQDREAARTTWEMERFGQNQVLRHLETQRQATTSTFTPTTGNAAGQE